MARTLSRYRRSIRWHIDRALEACDAGWEGWQIWAEAAAFLAERAARMATGDGAHALLVLAGTCRGAAASPEREGLLLLRAALASLPGARQRAARGSS